MNAAMWAVVICSKHLASMTGALRRRSWPGFGGRFLALGDTFRLVTFNGVAHRAERVAKVIDVRLGTLGRLHRADVRDVSGHHVGDGGAGRQRTVLARAWADSNCRSFSLAI